MFNGGRDVVVLAVSADPDTAQASWAHDASFPFVFASDTNHVIDNLYGSTNERQRTLRNLFVIAPDGRVSHVMRPFNVLSQDDYAALEQAVDRAGTQTSGGSGPQ